MPWAARIPLAAADLAHYVVLGGGIVTAGVALGGSVGFIAGALVHDAATVVHWRWLNRLAKATPKEWAETMAPYGGILGLTAFVMRVCGVAS